MYGNEDYVAAVVHQFHHLVDTPEVVFHLHKAAEDSHAVVDMNHIIPQIEGAEVVQGELFAFFNRPAEAYAVETVKYFMVCVPAYFIFVVNETRMDVLSFYELRQHGVLFLQHDGPQAFQLAFLLAEDVHLVSVFHLGPDVRKKQFETLVENRLRRDIEFHRRDILVHQGNIQEHMFEPQDFSEELLSLVHVGRVQPYRSVRLEQGEDTFSLFLIGFPGRYVRVNIGLLHFFDGKLRVTVEGVYFFHLVAEKAQAVRVFL